MEITPGRAPFSEDEDYTPLRLPKSVATTPEHANAFAMGGLGVGVSGGSTSINNTDLGMLNMLSSDPSARTISPTKLSPFAKEFVPRAGGDQQPHPQKHQQYAHQQQQQQQYNQQNYQQYQNPRLHRYSNGYQQQNHHNNHQQHQQQQQQQQQQHQQQMYTNQMCSLSANVQDRLKLGGGSQGGGIKNTSNNYYQQQQQQPPQPHQSRNNKPHFQTHNQSRYPPSHLSNAQYQTAAPSSSSSSSGAAAGGGSDVDSMALNYVQTVIQCLNQNPGLFDTIATRFLTIFDGMENNQYVLSVAMEDIFQESIQSPNFRYMGAKLYNLLHMLNLKKDSVFHTLLKMKLDFHQKEVQQYMELNEQHKVRETALFLAELYMQLRGDDTRIHLIAENIVYSLQQLLTKESVDNLRCICQTLKLAGYDLSTDCPEAMRGIIEMLNAINQHSPGKYPLAENVISLQKNNWGRKVSSSNSMCDPETAKPPEPLRISDEPIFYGPDGRELTAEEADFLCGSGAGLGSGSTDDDDDDDAADLDVDLDPEMDEEHEKAYKEFCKLNATT